MSGSQQYHDVESFGLIDGDNRNKDEIVDLQGRNIYALSQYSVESIYYCPDAMNAVAQLQAESLGADASQMVRAAEDAAIASLSQSGVDERLAARLWERQLREQIRSQMPDWKSILNGNVCSIEVETDGRFKEELNHFRKLLGGRNLELIISRYPVRDSKALDEINKQFSLSKTNYEKTLFTKIRNDSELAEKLRRRIGSLATARS